METKKDSAPQDNRLSGGAFAPPLSRTEDAHGTSRAPAPSESGYRRELGMNQIWQILNFASKAGFLVLLTPLMMSRWGPEGYGLFALASSLLVSMAILDGGVRALTRIRMASAWREGNEAEARKAYAEGLWTFVLVCLVAVVVAAVLASTGWVDSVLRLPSTSGGEAIAAPAVTVVSPATPEATTDEGPLPLPMEPSHPHGASGSCLSKVGHPESSGVLLISLVCTCVLMITLLGLEPLAARGKLSALKAANTWGALAAIPVCAALVLLGASIGLVVFAYATTLVIPNVVLAWQSGIFLLAPWRELPRFGPRVAFATLRDGFWYYMTTVSLVCKTHALTFLVSAMAGPAEAGLFYILLRLSEIVGNVGATASETSLAALASAENRVERHACFRQSLQYVMLFCGHGALVFVFLTGSLLSLWLPGSLHCPPGTGTALAAFGLAGAFSRVVINASMGLGFVSQASVAGIWEAVFGICCAVCGFRYFGLPGLFLGGAMGFVCLWSAAARVGEKCGDFTLWDCSEGLAELLTGFAAAGAILYASSLASSPLVWFAGLAACGGIVLFQIKRLHAHPSQSHSAHP